MNIHCMSRAEAQKLFRKMPAAEKEHYACISISDTWGAYPSGNILPGRTLYLGFDDIDPRVEETPRMQEPMRESQADSIASFVRQVYKDGEITDLVIHCNAGVSRSVGVAAALEGFLCDRRLIVVGSRQKMNRWCYDLVRKALYRAMFADMNRQFCVFHPNLEEKIANIQQALKQREE